jgi:tol-pal system protein YbgF
MNKLAKQRLENFYGHGFRQKLLASAVMCFAVAFLMPGSLYAQGSELKPLLDRLERMERDIRTLNVQVSRGAPAGGQSGTAASPGTVSAGGPALARFEVRLSALEEELRVVTGKMESESHQIDQMNKRLDKLISDIDFRLSALEKSISGAGARPANTVRPGPSGQPVIGSVSPAVPVERAPRTGQPAGTLGTLNQSDLTAKSTGKPSGTPATRLAPKTTKTQQQAAAGLPKGSAKDQYAYAFSLLRQAKYKEAESALKAFIAKHNKHPLASNARYWLGESYYVQAQYAEAAKIFYKAYQSNKKGNKAPDALLKLGMSLSGLKKQAQACAAFSKLTSDYPTLQPSIKKKLAEERKRARCR